MQNSLAIPRALGKIGAYLSQLNPPNFLVGLIIFFSATQLGFHFWPLTSLVYGIRIDYLSPTIYFLDILVILFLGSDLLQRTVLRRNSRLQAEKGSVATERTVLMGTLTPILLTNLLYSDNPLSTLSWSLHFLLYLFFVVALFPGFRSLSGLQRSERQIGTLVATQFENLRIYDLRLILTLSLLFQLVLSLIQVFLGHSVGGLMYYLGERSVSVGSPAVALGSFIHEVVLRAYGTFGHPNVLAGWSVVVLLILLRLRGQSSTTRLLWLSTTLTASLIFLTQSRAAALSLFGIIIPFYFFKNFKSRALYFFIGLLVYWFIYPPLLSPPRSDLSISERLDLQGVSLKAISHFPVFGTGAQASISTYPTISPEMRLLQPDHNSFTLFLSWFGIFGLLAILYTLRSQFENLRIYDLRLIVPLLPLLLFDHYLLTSPQGLFIIVLYFFTIRKSE